VFGPTTFRDGEREMRERISGNPNPISLSLSLPLAFLLALSRGRNKGGVTEASLAVSGYHCRELREDIYRSCIFFFFFWFSLIRVFIIKLYVLMQVCNSSFPSFSFGS
jgi:hypothetical protein